MAAPTRFQRMLGELLEKHGGLRPELVCVDCHDSFTLEEALAHSEPGECVEWSNHQMVEATFTVRRT